MTEQQPYEVVDHQDGFELRRIWWPESSWTARLVRWGFHRRRQPLASPDRDDRSGHPAEGGPGKDRHGGPVVQQTGGRPSSGSRPVGFDLGDPQLEHGYDPDRAYRTPS
jgi:hypothetical protein